MPEPETDLDHLDPDAAAEQAFHRCETHTFNGEVLEPLTFARDAATARIGLRYETWGDSLYLIFLCRTPAAEVRKLFSAKAIEAWREKADEWADALGVHPNSPLAHEANEVATAILGDKYAAEFHTRDERGSGPSAPTVEKKTDA